MDNMGSYLAEHLRLLVGGDRCSSSPQIGEQPKGTGHWARKAGQSTPDNSKARSQHPSTLSGLHGQEGERPSPRSLSVVPANKVILLGRF